jgi:CHAD domain-containing protein
MAMASRFRRREKVSDGFRRIVRDEMALVVSLLADRGSDLKERIHEARRGLKRLRALLRLVDSERSEPVLSAAERTFRTAGRRLSKPRDAEVTLATFDALVRKFPAASTQPIRLLLAEREARARRNAENTAQLAEIASRIRDAAHRAAQLTFADEGWLLIAPGIARAFRSARKQYRHAKASDDPAIMHEWRKDVKRLLNHLALLCPGLSKPLRKFIAKLDRLATALGDHHDLELLASTLREDHAHGVRWTNATAIEDAITRRMAAKRRKSLKLGTCLKGRTKALMHDLHRAWKTWQKPN